MFWQVKDFKQKNITLWKTEWTRHAWKRFQKQSKQNFWKRICVEIGPWTINFVTPEIWPLFFSMNTEQYGWIQNPVLANAEMSKHELSLPVRKNNLELQNDRTLLKLSDVSTWWILDLYWKGILVNFERGYWNFSSVLHYILVWTMFLTFVIEQKR